MIEKRTKELPIAKPCMGDEEINAVVECMKTGQITTGPKVQILENMFKSEMENNAIACSSATAGLHLVLMAYGIGKGDEVGVPSITWGSCANMVEIVGAKPVFIDVDDSMLIDTEDFGRKISPKMKAVIVVHYAGFTCNMNRVRQIIGDDVIIIEDAAHAIGSRYPSGTAVGANKMSEATIFSFHAVKNMTCGEGGMILVDDDFIAERIRSLLFHGVKKDFHYVVEEAGMKYNMMDIQAAIAIEQFKKLSNFNEKRRKLVKKYLELVRENVYIHPLDEYGNGIQQIGVQLMVFRILFEHLTLNKEEFMQELAKRNIATRFHFMPLHESPYYRKKYGYLPNCCPTASEAKKEVLSVPLFAEMTFEDVEYVVATMNEIIKDKMK